MRFVLAVSLSLAVLATACTTTQTVEIGSGADGDAQVLADERATTSSTSIQAPSTTSTTTSTPDEVEFDPSDYLLTPDDLPGWKHVRPWSFPAEPTFEAVNCELMATVWSAHGQDGTRVRASTDGVSVRHSVVQMPDIESAEAIIDAANVVWEECNPLTLVTEDEWWVEPIEVPDVQGWRSAGLALGVSDDYIWSIAWFQQETTVVFLDLDSANPWQVIQPVLEATAGRLTGAPRPLPTPEPEPPVIVLTSTTTTPGTGELQPTTTVSADGDAGWRDHPAAGFVPDPALFGSGYEVDWVRIQERAPSDPDDVIEGCEVDAPPTMDGLRADYGHQSDSVEIEVLIGIDDLAWAQDTVDSFRALGSCEGGALGERDLTVSEPETGADDAVILDVAMPDGTETFGFRLVAARYGDTMIAIFVAVDNGPDALPSIGELTRWAESIVEQS